MNIFKFWPSCKLKEEGFEGIILMKLSFYFYFFKSLPLFQLN